MKTLKTIELTPLTAKESAMAWGGEIPGIPIIIMIRGADGTVGELPIDSEP